MTAKRYKELAARSRVPMGFVLLAGYVITAQPSWTRFTIGSGIALLGILPSDTRIDWDQVIFKGVTLKGIYGREMFETWYKMTQMVLGGLDLRPVLTHHIPIDEFQKGFDLMASGQCGKVVCAWN